MAIMTVQLPDGSRVNVQYQNAADLNFSMRVPVGDRRRVGALRTQPMVMGDGVKETAGAGTSIAYTKLP